MEVLQMEYITDSAIWNTVGIILFLSVFVVIGLNLTVFADYEEIEEDQPEIWDLC
jgi:hypothetical protein